ncbi:hypothetical protein PPSC2_25875 (plasmid) [Paenibacillus polymyxa SC2]|uniref:Uncharacterized protein n=2 Tax=Paenibacillus polymyxa TaxID=1406 RepID=E3EKN1_PAEPS|nr:hypothetical protein PPSC2_25875 [Paenibacillus polymyxa SC2]
MVNENKTRSKKTKNYNIIAREDIEGIIVNLENERIELNDQMVKAQENKLDDLVALYRGQYFATGKAIEKLNELLEIPFEDVVIGVQIGVFDRKTVVKQLDLVKELNSEPLAETFAEILVASWRGDILDSSQFHEFEKLQHQILKDEKDTWALSLTYGISSELSKKIIHSWKKQIK